MDEAPRDDLFAVIRAHESQAEVPPSGPAHAPPALDLSAAFQALSWKLRVFNILGAPLFVALVLVLSDEGPALIKVAPVWRNTLIASTLLYILCSLALRWQYWRCPYCNLRLARGKAPRQCSRCHGKLAP